jgi:hypothetical protein
LAEPPRATPPQHPGEPIPFGSAETWLGRIAKIITALERLQKVEDGLSKASTRFEERLRDIEDRLTRIEGWQTTADKNTETLMRAVATSTVSERMEAIYDRLAKIEVKLPKGEG